MTTSTTNEKYDVKKEFPQLYAPKKGTVEHVLVPQLTYIAISGKGSPDGAEFQAAMGALYSVAYPLKFHSKLDVGRDYAVGPTEGLWWADDPEDFTSGNKSQWQWTLLSVLPPWIRQEDLDVAVAKAEEHAMKTTAGGAVAGVLEILKRVQLVTLTEGLCLQVLYVGPYAEESRVLTNSRTV